MTCEIIAVGTELLLGNTLNTNAHYLSQHLPSIGVEVIHHTVVGDNSSRLKEAIKIALSRCEIVITTGGLGPTADDITKETVCEFLGAEMELNKDALNEIEAFFKRISRNMTKSNIKQAYLPKGCTIFKNEVGTAPGFGLVSGSNIIITLPGPPFEMEYMYNNFVEEYLRKFCNSSLFSTYIRIFGIGESTIDEQISHLMSMQNPTVAPYAGKGEVLLRVTAKAESEDEAMVLKKPLIDEIKQRFSEYIYGINVNSLEEQVVTMLKASGKRVATAESCTGGLLSQRITSISGSSDVFECGICSYSNEIKQKILGVSKDTLEKYGAVSKEVAIEMANGVQKLSGSDIGVSITGIAGPGGGSEQKPVGLVFVAVCTKEKSFAEKLIIGRGYSDEREYIRYVSASTALNMVLKEI